MAVLVSVVGLYNTLSLFELRGTDGENTSSSNTRGKKKNSFFWKGREKSIPILISRCCCCYCRIPHLYRRECKDRKSFGAWFECSNTWPWQTEKSPSWQNNWSTLFCFNLIDINQLENWLKKKKKKVRRCEVNANRDNPCSVRLTVLFLYFLYVFFFLLLLRWLNNISSWGKPNR